MPGGIALNGNSLQTTGISQIITSNIDHHSMPKKNISMAALAYGNRSKITNSNYVDKQITISGTLAATNGSIITMDALEDTFKSYLVGTDGNLDIEHGSSTRRYLATPEVVKIDRNGGLAFGTFEVTFTCSRPFGIDLTATQLDLTTGHTAATRLIPIAIVGSAEYQFPLVKITLVSGTQLTNGTISIGNNANGQTLNITSPTWAAGDVLEIDPYESIVKINSVEVPFTGAFPSFKSGTQFMTYTDTFLTRSVNFDISQYGYWN